MDAFMTSNLSYEHLRKVQLVSLFFPVLQDSNPDVFFLKTATSSIRAASGGAHWSFESSLWGCTSSMHCKHVTYSACPRRYRKISINNFPNSRFQIFRSPRRLPCPPIIIVRSLRCGLHRTLLLLDHTYPPRPRGAARHHQSQAIEEKIIIGIGMSRLSKSKNLTVTFINSIWRGRGMLMRIRLRVSCWRISCLREIWRTYGTFSFHLSSSAAWGVICVYLRIVWQGFGGPQPR